ncbi:MAG TPA: GNAT family N-acetyltransferase [Gaiellales bacterium]|nr:GNAT family N-acetyltransferase [Gaiellales bacterium]
MPSITPQWQIRRLAPDEVEAVGSVLGLARLNQGDGFYLVAWEGAEPAGHAYLALTDPPEMQDVEVRAEFRRRGAASALAAAVEAEAGRRGHTILRITVSAGSEQAQALYHRLGYADTGLPAVRVKGVVQIRTGPLEVDDTLLTWEKPLPGA